MTALLWIAYLAACFTFMELRQAKPVRRSQLLGEGLLLAAVVVIALTAYEMGARS